jgi:hypothetical protein
MNKDSNILGISSVPMATRGPIYFDERCFEARGMIKAWAKNVIALKSHPVFEEEIPQWQDRGEMIANVVLAYRHMEDAAMRLGKAIQAFDGGKSVYDK